MCAANRSSVRRPMPIGASCARRWIISLWRILFWTRNNNQPGSMIHPGKTSSSWTEMAIDHVIPELDREGLRKFGLTTGAVFVAIFGLFFLWILDKNWPTWPWFVAAPLWALALIHPPSLRLIYLGWMHFGLLASRV